MQRKNPVDFIGELNVTFGRFQQVWDERYGMDWYFIIYRGKIMVCYTALVYKYLDIILDIDLLSSCRVDVKQYTKNLFFDYLLSGNRLFKELFVGET